jgi:adenylate kinase family enzyme
MMNNVFTVIGILSTTVLSVWAALRYVLLGTYKIDNDTSKRLIEQVEADATYKWVLTNEHVVEPRYPSEYEAFVLMRGCLFFVSRTEKLLTAGWKGKEEVSRVVFPRWQRAKMLETIKKHGTGEPTIPVMALTPHGSDRLGALTPDSNSTPVVASELWRDIEIEVESMLNHEGSKLGVLLHGAPGNGKTRFIKHLAKKYSLPVYVVYLNPEYSNLDIAMMFASIPRKCLVLMEDFDNYFDGRECLMKNEQVKFTFDAFINALDGIHNDYKQVVFALTANDLSKIDDSLKKRPSRFKYVKEFGCPSADARRKILDREECVAETEGMTLDQVFAYKADKML